MAMYHCAATYCNLRALPKQLLRFGVAPQLGSPAAAASPSDGIGAPDPNPRKSANWYL